jgi:hypothetical protein
LLCAVPVTAFAEVMDKEPTIGEVWLLALGASVVAFVACRWKPWLALVTAPYPLLYLASFVSEITDPYVGPAIRAEAGLSYIFWCSGAFAVVAAAHIGGIVLSRRRHLTQVRADAKSA